MVQEFRRKLALQSAREYFQRLLDNLESLRKDVERYRDKWEEVVSGGRYPDGARIPKDHLIREIEWCVNATRNLDLLHPEAVRVVARLARTFDIE